MENTVSKVIFEHPLNEKMRTCLRIEFLINQLEQNKVFDKYNPLSFFYTLSELLEITERNELKTDLVKDLEEQRQKLSAWFSVPGVDTSILNELVVQLNQILNQLNTEPKIGKNLKDDKLISSIRKRLTIPGGCCNFDLPQFHLWLHQPQQYRDEQVSQWLDDFSTLYQASSIHLKLIRESSHFKPHECVNNFFRQHHEAINLLRIRLPVDAGVYPQISGNTDRYTIRFIPLQPTEANNEPTKFELACCL